MVTLEKWLRMLFAGDNYVTWLSVPYFWVIETTASRNPVSKRDIDSGFGTSYLARAVTIRSSQREYNT